MQLRSSRIIVQLRFSSVNNLSRENPVSTALFFSCNFIALLQQADSVFWGFLPREHMRERSWEL